jgi:hypothetical protein
MENWGSQHLPAIFHNIQNGKYDNLIPMKSVIYEFMILLEGLYTAHLKWSESFPQWLQYMTKIRV